MQTFHWLIEFAYTQNAPRKTREKYQVFYVRYTKPLSVRPLLILFLQRKRLVKLLIIAIAFFALYQIVSITRTVQMPMVLKFPSHRAEIPLEKASLNVLKDQEVITSGLNAHIWYDVCPSSIQAFCNYPLFPKAANEKTVIRTPDLTRNQDTYVQRIFGYLHPPRTGKYRFAIASDDFSELWLSASEDPAKAVLICKVDEWVGRGEYQHETSQISRKIELKQDEKYYMEILHVQLGGEDFFNVRWSVPDKVTKSTYLYSYSCIPDLFLNILRNFFPIY